MLTIISPTGKSSKCLHCGQRLSGKIPKIKFSAFKYGSKYERYICFNCTKLHHRPNKEFLEKYKQLILTKYTEISVVEEL